MKYYEYDSNGWLIGWHEDAERPLSTSLDYTPIPPANARFVDGVWINGGEHLTSDQKAAKIGAAWSAASRHIESQFDSYSQISATNLRMDPNCPLERTAKIEQVIQWIQNVWSHYAQVKASINSGQDAQYNPSIPGNCPYTIWDISA